MKITKVGEASIDQIFKAIKASLKDDYFKNTKTELDDHAIKPGLTYLKQFGKNNQNSVRVTLKEFVAPSVYTIVFSSNRGQQDVTYQLKAVDENHTEITYSFHSQPKDLFQKGNDFLMKRLFKKSMERQSEAQLEALIRYSKN